MIVKTSTMRWPAIGAIRFALSRDLRGIDGVLMKGWFIFIVCLWASQASAQGTYTAASCSQSALSAAITAEQAHPVDGDIISIPSGTCTWNSGTPISATFNNSVTIQGAGAISATSGGASTTGSDLTAIINNEGGDQPVMIFTTTAGKSFRFTGIAILENASTGSAVYNGSLQVQGQSSSVRIDHCHFFIAIGGSKGLGFLGGVTGVADHIYVNTTQTVTNNFVFQNGANWQNDSDPNGYGDKSWVDGDHFGGSQYIYIEDSQVSGGYVSDCSTGGRYVFRHSTVLNTNGLEEHGTAESPYRGCRASELYQNTFNNTTAVEGGGIVHSNSGTTLIWGNTINTSGQTSVGFYHAIDLNTVRQGARGMIAYPPNGFGMCGNVTQSNGLNETSPWDGNQNSTTGWPCLDQPGRGAGDLLTGSFPTVCDQTLGCTTFNGQWPRQALVPVYVWNNILTGIGAGYVADNTSGLLADNRDYYQSFGPLGESGSFNGTKGVGQGLLSARPSTCTAGSDPKTGGSAPGVGYWATDTNTLYVCNPTNTWTAYYTPYTYPHPLTQSSGATVAAPTNLTATVN